ncbi:MAG: hypothetical protein WBG28_01065 [Desulfobulbales bacterium]
MGAIASGRLQNPEQDRVPAHIGRITVHYDVAVAAYPQLAKRLLYLCVYCGLPLLIFGEKLRYPGRQSHRAGDMPFAVGLRETHIDNNPPRFTYFVHHELRVNYYLIHFHPPCSDVNFAARSQLLDGLQARQG